MTEEEYLKLADGAFNMDAAQILAAMEEIRGCWSIHLFALPSERNRWTITAPGGVSISSPSLTHGLRHAIKEQYYLQYRESQIGQVSDRP